MTEEYNDDRLTTGFIAGTVTGTILSAPVNYSAYIWSFRYTYASAVGTGTVLAEIITQRLGTLTGTIDVVTLTAAIGNVRDSVPSHPIGRVEAGDQLCSLILLPSAAAASIMGVVSYQYVPGRLTGP